MSISIQVTASGPRHLVEIMDESLPALATSIHVFRTFEEASRYAVKQANLLSFVHAGASRTSQ